jgi:hypothetical protein
MTNRYEIIIKNDEGQEIVSDIKQMEGAAPEIGFGKAVKVPDGVLIGMVKGGPVNSVAGYGFPEGTAAVRSDPGGVKAEKADEAKDDAAKSKAAKE